MEVHPIYSREDSMSVSVARILVFPIKSLPPVEVSEAEVLPSGALKHDRQFAFVDADGNYLNGKRTPKVHQLRTQFDLQAMSVELSTAEAPEQAERFSLHDDQAALAAWASEFFGQEVSLSENAEQGFPDDREANGPTFVSQATLAKVAEWFAPLSVEEVALRFRTNIELAAEQPFWEDRLTAEQPRRFRVGDVTFLGTGICQRCVVPSRDPFSGEVMPKFGKRFMEQRQAELPAWAPRERFDHFFRLTINTQLAPESPGGILQVGNVVELA